MAICTTCQRDMLQTDRCEYPFVRFAGDPKVYARHKGSIFDQSVDHAIFISEHPDHKCHDCGALFGQLHHDGCDSEKCPRCGGQFFCCDCPEHRELLRNSHGG